MHNKTDTQLSANTKHMNFITLTVKLSHQQCDTTSNLERMFPYVHWTPLGNSWMFSLMRCYYYFYLLLTIFWAEQQSRITDSVQVHLKVMVCWYWFFASIACWINNIIIKGSVERSSLPWAIFLIFTRNRPWKSEDHLCTLFFIDMSKESLEKSERTPRVSWRLWALAYSRDRPYNFSCLSAVSKNRRFRSFSSALGCHLARKSLLWPAMSVSNKKQEFEHRKRIKLFDDFWVRAYRFDFAPRRRPRARSI